MKKFSLKTFSSKLLTAGALLFININPVFAAGSTKSVVNPIIGKFGQPSGDNKEGTVFITYVITMWRAALTIGGLAVLGFYVWGAFEWLTSGSDPKGVEKGRSRIVNATIGLILLVSTFTIVGFVGNLLFDKEFNLMQITFPTAEEQTYGQPSSSPEEQNNAQQRQQKYIPI